MHTSQSDRNRLDASLIRGLILRNRGLIEVVCHTLDIDEDLAASDAHHPDGAGLCELAAVTLADAEHLSTLRDALHDGDIDIVVPKIVTPEVEIFTKQEAAAILDALADEPLQFQACIQLAILTGARLGELVALKFSDVDFDNHKIKIERAIS